jgi:hypothetical protein
MLDPEVAACACVGLEAARGTAVVPAVRDLALKRRRSKIPWIYAVYHAARPAPGPAYACFRRRMNAGIARVAVASSSAAAS